MTDPRKPVFDAVRALVPAVFDDPGNILALDNLLDAFGAARDKPAHRTINAAGRDIVKRSEGCKLTGYLCPANIPTIGWGHTGPDVKVGMKITQAQADALLAQDLRTFEEGVTKLCSPATDNQFSALVSFAFNLGLEALRTSTLRRKHNEGDYAGAKAEFAKWNKAGGKVLRGLTIRRSDEAELYGRRA